jgi:hypothetical protein
MTESGKTTKIKLTSFNLSNYLSVSRIDGVDLAITSNELVVDEKTGMD